MTSDTTETGPPPSHPKANVLFDGFRTEIERYPESTEVVYERREETFRALCPRNGVQNWFTDDIALTQIRIERVCRIERRMRDRAALRAEFFWDDDRRLIAEELGERLSKKPARVVRQLRATPQGCDWMAERWTLLLGIITAGKAWDEAQTKLAQDLIGTPVELRGSAEVVARFADPEKLTREELANLEVQEAKVKEADILDRSLTMADQLDPDTPEFRSNRRYEASLQRRMRWSMAQLDLIPKFTTPHYDLSPNRACNLAPAAEPEPAPASFTPLRPVGLEPVAAVAVPVQAPTRPRRPDPVTLRAQARQAARRRRQDRPDR